MDKGFFFSSLFAMLMPVPRSFFDYLSKKERGTEVGGMRKGTTNYIKWYTSPGDMCLRRKGVRTRVLLVGLQ